MSKSQESGARLTAWSAIIGSILGYISVALSLAVTGEDSAMVFHGATMLALPAGTRELLRASMLFDILGFYLPLILIGGYLWNTFREEARAPGDMALLALVVHLALGIAGAAMQQAAIDPLAHLHGGGDDAVKASAEAAWTTVASVSQKGLWWCEGPLMLIWALIVGAQLKRAGWGRSLFLKVVGCMYGLFFVFGFFPGLNAVTDLIETAGVLAFPLWMLMFGWQLLRRPAVAPAH